MFQRLALLSDQPGVFHRDHGLGGKVLQQSNLSVGKRAHLLPLGADITEHRLILTQRHEQRGADTSNFGKRATQWITFERGRRLRTVEDMNEPFAAEE